MVGFLLDILKHDGLDTVALAESRDGLRNLRAQLRIYDKIHLSAGIIVLESPEQNVECGAESVEVRLLTVGGPARFL